jgi:hypothetical protein
MHDNPNHAPTQTPIDSSPEVKRPSIGLRIVGHLLCLGFLGFGAIVVALFVSPADPFSFLLLSMFLMGGVTAAYALGYFLARRGW